jgi:hypothetical protein
VVGLALAYPLHAIALPTKPNYDYTTNPAKSQEVVFLNDLAEAATSTPQIKQDIPKKTQIPTNKGTSTKNAHPVSAEAISQYLAGSPLQPFAERIAQSPYSATIIGICAIEQYGCQKAPYYSPYNFWGLMSKGQLIKFASQEEAIDYIHLFLDKAYNNGRTTIESMRGWYCASACTNWEPTVLKIKFQLENTYQAENPA